MKHIFFGNSVFLLLSCISFTEGLQAHQLLRTKTQIKNKFSQSMHVSPLRASISQTIDEQFPTEAVFKSSASSPSIFRQIVNKVYSSALILWDFTRPHTIVGSGLSVLALFAFAVPRELWFTKVFMDALLASMLPALLMNLYITGLNQITDVDIDKINKPYLPIAANRLNLNDAIAIVIASLIGSLLLVKSAAWPLQMTVIGSGILGTLYSLPPFRLKRFPLLAALFILVVRGALVNLGFILQAKSAVLGISLPSIATACVMFPESVLLTAFFAVFGLVIALMKDVPDIEGDKRFQVASFSVQQGGQTMFR